MPSSSLSPMDLLDMPDDERRVLRCLSRKPGLDIFEISEELNTDVTDLQTTISRLISKSQVVEQLDQGRRVFTVRYGQRKSRLKELPPSLLKMFEEPPDVFLSGVALASTLTPDERKNLLAISTNRQVMPNEVVVWQGNPMDQVGLVRMGLLKKTRLLKGKQRQDLGYVRRGEWFGLSEVLGKYSSFDTCTAITEGELLVWRADDFLEFVRANPQVGLAINSLLSQQVHQLEYRQMQGSGQLWVVDALEHEAGATTIAANLAFLAAQGGGGSDAAARVLLWNADNKSEGMLKMLGIDSEGLSSDADQNVRLRSSSGFDILLTSEKSAYPPQVQLEMLLNDLKAEYEYIICDTGQRADDEFLLGLRAQADLLITVTRNPESSPEAMIRWSKLHPSSRPAQRRVLALNAVKPGKKQTGSAFQIILPYDPSSASEAASMGKPVVDGLPESSLARALVEASNRLYLNHTIGIFVPSTVSFDHATDSEPQVKRVLEFLGNIFGGATKSQAEGIWQGDDKTLVSEQVTIVRTFVSESALQQHLDDVIAFASMLKKELDQEAVAIDVDNQLILI